MYMPIDLEFNYELKEVPHALLFSDEKYVIFKPVLCRNLVKSGRTTKRPTVMSS